MLRKCLFLSIVMTVIPGLSACSGTVPMPIEEERGEFVNEVSADVIHELINQGEIVEIKNAVVTGHLLDNEKMTVPTKSVSVLDWPSATTRSVKVVKSRISFTDCIFREYLDLSDVLFESEVSFEGCYVHTGLTESPWMSSWSVYSDGALFESDLSFAGGEFDGIVEFTHCHFMGNVIFGGTFRGSFDSFGSLYLWDSLFDGEADFFGTFENGVTCNHCTFNDRFRLIGDFQEGLDLWNTRLCGDAWFTAEQFGGYIIPPKSFTGNILYLDWENVSHTVPLRAASHCYAAWENLFLAAGDYHQARQVHRSGTRHELGLWLLLWLVVFAMVTFIFALLYYRRLRSVPRRSRLQHLRRALLFSLDVLTPGIGAYKYNWETSLPVNKVVVLTSIESALGWILIGAGAAIGVSWLVA